jgi:transmembrane sensor
MNRILATPDQPDVDAVSAAIKQAAAEWKARADAGLSPREQADLHVWLDADPRHRAALARFDLVWEKFDGPFYAGATDELLHELDVRAGRRRRKRMVSAAAGLLVLLAVGSLWRFAGRPEAKHSLTTNAVLLLPECRTLPDGSVAELKPGAEIAVEFTPEVRRVALRRGEVLFQVMKDATHPFVVAAGGIEARAVGTAFTVELRSTAVAVFVTEGRVSVNQAPSPPSASSSPVSTQPVAVPEPFAVLDVGKSIVVDIAPQPAAPQITSVQPDELAERLAWRAPRVEFTRTSLAEAVAMLNGYSAGRRSAGQRSVQFIIGDPALNEVRISGLFRVDKTDAFVGLLKKGFGIDAEPRGDSEIILRKAR